MVDYDQIFRDKPSKWDDLDRDRLIYQILNNYLKREPETLLDIGCGNGHTLNRLSSYWHNTKLYGVDISEVAIRLARASLSKAKFICGDIKNVSIPYTFEVITIMGVLEHFEKPVEILKNIRSLMQSDSIVYLELPNNLRLAGISQERFYPSSLQEEWFLSRETWEQIIIKADYKIEESIKGSNLFCEFIWILK